MRITLSATAYFLLSVVPAFSAESSLPSGQMAPGIPFHYKPGQGGCRSGAGYSFVAEAPTHPSTYPKLILRVFDGEIIGVVFEADASAGWKPWYDQPADKPVSHGNGPAHYSQSVYFKSPPTAADCAKSEGPYKGSGEPQKRPD